MTGETPTVVCIGEALAVGRVPPTGLTDTLPLGVGGAELNVAVALRHAGHSVCLATRVGDDPLGALVEGALKEAGVEVLLERDAAAPTGLYLRTEGVGRNAVYYRHGSAGSRLPDTHLLHRRIRAARRLHVTGVTAALRPENVAALLDLTGVARESGCTVSFDVNYRARLWPADVAAPALRQIARSADLVLVGADEAEELWGARDAAEVSQLLSVPELVYKAGEDRRVDVVRNGRMRSYEVPAVTVADSVGAGDAFAAGYLHALLSNESSVRRRVEVGHAFASAVMSSPSDVLSREGVADALDRVRRH